MNAGIDVRGVLENIHLPTLLIHRKGDVRVDPEASRYLARRISGAKLVEIPGTDHPIWTGDVDRVADVIEDFLTGTHAESEIRRVLAVVLATRIGNGARLGDRMWDERCQDFHDTWRMIVARHGGRIVSAHGEVMVCRFEGPARAMHCAEALREAANAAAVTCAQGVHVGEIEPHGPPEGLTVRVAMRIAAQAGRDDILVSRLAADLAAGSGLHFTPAEPILLDELDHPLQLVEAKSEQHLEPVNHASSRAFERDALTMRESEVVALIADGKSNAAIAAELRLSAHTVKRHVANILLKLDLPSRAAAAAFVARQSGPDEP
jgi:DNA-binding CsgD family transcriptional regulator